MSLQGYLRSPDPSLEKQVGDSRDEFEALLPEFVKQNPKLFPQTAAEEIRRTFGLFKEAIARTMDTNARRMEQRSRLDSNFERILFLIDHNLRPMIRKDQADGEERSEAILNIENQTRAWQQNLVQAWAAPTDAAKALTFENDNRGQTYLDLYGGMELLPRERKILKELRALWLTNSDLARESYVEEGIVNQMEKAMDGTRDQVVGTLNQFLPAMPPGELDAKKQSIMRDLKWRFAAAFGIGLLGLGTLIAIALTIYRMPKVTPPVADGIYRAPPAEDRPRPQEPSLQMDLQGVITQWSRGAQTLYGYTSDEILGQTIGKLFESESEISRLGREMQAAKQATFETTHKTKAGASILVRIEFLPVTDKSGQTSAIGLLCTQR